MTSLALPQKSVAPLSDGCRRVTSADTHCDRLPAQVVDKARGENLPSQAVFDARDVIH